MQADLDKYMRRYNLERTIYGKRCLGRNPAEAFEQGLELCAKYPPCEKSRCWANKLTLFTETTDGVGHVNVYRFYRN